MYKIYFFLLTILVTFSLSAQITTGELPPNRILKNNIQLKGEHNFQEKLIIPKPNVKQLLKEDEADLKEGKAWRFGTAIDSNFSISTKGKWQHFSNGKSLWTFEVMAEGAYSLNFNFDTFKLSPSAKLFIYNTPNKDYLGALTKANNTEDLNMASRPIKGNRIQFELWVNSDELNQNLFSCKEVVYAYKDIFNKTDKSFGSSGSCNININCEEGDPWQDIKRSVVMTLTNNNTRLCTGTLLNNTAQDSTPYVLTANHCGNTASIFVFNYESSACSPNTNGSLSNSIYGATLRARNFDSDFILYELSSVPPASYQVYYAGWSAVASPAEYATCIHHPSGDVKKISIAQGAVISDTYNNTGTVENHWRVKRWEKGTTESGSSGSPLFNESQRVVGQLQGGTASCNNSTGSDYYGKFSTSWNTATDSSQKLSHWLDPINTSQLEIDGFDPSPASYNLDLELKYNYNLPFYTCESLNFNFLVKNVGNLPVDSFIIDFYINNQLINSKKHTIKLTRNQTIIIPAYSNPDTFGTADVKIVIKEVNGTVDQNSTNDTLINQLFYNSSPISMFLELKTDDYGSETTWEVSSNSAFPTFRLYEGGPYPNIEGGNTYKDTLCFYDSCFKFTLYDTFNDGFNGGFGDGYLYLKSDSWDTVIYENNFTSGQKTYTFCIEDTSTIIIDKKKDNAQFKLYPNPIRKGQVLNWTRKGYESQVMDIQIHNLQGEIVLKYKQVKDILIPNYLSQGMYILKAKADYQDEWQTKEKLIIY